MVKVMYVDDVFEVFIFSFYFFGYRKSHGTSTVMYFLLPVQERDDDEEEIHCR